MEHQELLTKLGFIINKFVHLKSGRLRLFIVLLLIFGLIGLVVWQGIIKPESSLSALEPVLPHATGEIFENQSVLLNLPIEGVMIFVSPNTFARSEGTIVAFIKNSDHGSYDIKSDWIDQRELNIEYINPKGIKQSGLTVEKPIEFCFFISDQKEMQKKPSDLHLSELVFWGYDQKNETWRAISTNIPEDGGGLICGKSNQLTKFVLVGISSALIGDR